MKRLSMLLVFAVTTACSEQKAAVPAPPVAPPAPVYSESWFTDGAGASMLSIHQTQYGLAGRLMDTTGKFYPVRNLVMSDTAMSFIAPALEATWTATKNPEGGWSGKWTEGGKTPEDVVLTPTGAPAAASASDGVNPRFVKLADGRQVYIDCRGTGAPAVIFDSGAGGWSKDWAAVQPEIAKTTLACTYDRAGHGLSDPRPLPLDTAAVADDLDMMLTAAAIPGPYILVGHSLGSYHVRQFANTRFDKMAGLVLVDPSGDGQSARFQAVIPEMIAEMAKRDEEAKAAHCVERLREKLVLRSDPLFKTCKGTNDADMFEQTQSEIDSMPGASTEELTQSHRSWGNMPLVVLTRGDYVKGMPPGFTNEDRKAMQSVWVAMHEEMTALSSAGQHRTVEGAGHIIQGDKPQAVIDAVNDIVAAARAKQP